MNKEEFKKFYEDAKEIKKYYSGDYDDPTDRYDTTYELYNLFSPEDGVTVTDIFMIYVKVWIPLWFRLFIRDNCETSSHLTYKIQ